MIDITDPKYTPPEQFDKPSNEPREALFWCFDGTGEEFNMCAYYEQVNDFCFAWGNPNREGKAIVFHKDFLIAVSYL